MFSERTGWLAFGKQIRKYLLGTYVLNAFKMILDFLLYNIYLSVNVFLQHTWLVVLGVNLL